MDIFVLQNIWFALICVLLSAFLILGGFDFGACMLSLRSRRGADFAMKSILPFWDANQVWLITAGGALFAAFPEAYSAVLSNLYVPVMLLLAAVVVRVASIEFYFAGDSDLWRNFWRRAAAASASLSMLLLGVALGVVFTGRVFGREGGFWEAFAALFAPATVLCGLCVLFFSCVQGGIFLCLSGAEGEELFFRRVRACFWLELLCFACYIPCLGLGASGLALFLAAFAAALAAHFLFARGAFAGAIAMNSLFALLAVAAHAAAAYPFVVPPEISVENSSSKMTLTVMLWVAGIGVPLVLAYTVYAYRVFLRGGARR